MRPTLAAKSRLPTWGTVRRFSAFTSLLHPQHLHSLPGPRVSVDMKRLRASGTDLTLLVTPLKLVGLSRFVERSMKGSNVLLWWPHSLRLSWFCRRRRESGRA